MSYDPEVPALVVAGNAGGTISHVVNVCVAYPECRDVWDTVRFSLADEIARLTDATGMPVTLLAVTLLEPEKGAVLC